MSIRIFVSHASRNDDEVRILQEALRDAFGDEVLNHVRQVATKVGQAADSRGARANTRRQIAARIAGSHPFAVVGASTCETVDARRRFGSLVESLRERIQPLRDKHHLDEDFERRVKRHWMAGHAKAINGRWYEFLEETCGPQREVAEFLALKGHSAVSKNKKSGTLTAEQIWFIISEHLEDAIEILYSEDVREEATIEGYLEAISHIREKELKDTTYQRRLTREEYECLRRVLSSEDWADARRSEDEQLLQTVGTNILDEIHEEIAGQSDVRNVYDMVHVIEQWGRPFCLCVGTLAWDVVL